jgi:double-strand break repair protein MRE11
MKDALEDEEENFSFKANMDDRSKEIERVIERRVQELLDCLDHDRDASLKEKLPLLRLRVDYSGYTTINSQRFGQKFVGKVANPNDIILFTKKVADKAKAKEGEEGAGGRGKDGNSQQQMATSVEDLNALINDNLKVPLEVLDLQDLNRALHNFVEKDNQKAFHECVERSIAKSGSARGDEPMGDEEEGKNDDMDNDFFMSDDEEERPPVRKKKATRKAPAATAKARPAKKQKKTTGGTSKQKTSTQRSLPLSMTQAGNGKGAGGGTKGKRSLPLSLTQTQPTTSRKTRKKASASKVETIEDSEDSLDFITPAPTREAPGGTSGVNFVDSSEEDDDLDLDLSLSAGKRTTQRIQSRTRKVPASWGKCKR